MNEKTKKPRSSAAQTIGLTAAGELAVAVASLASRTADLELEVGAGSLGGVEHRISELEAAVMILNHRIGELSTAVSRIEARPVGEVSPEQVASVVVSLVERHAIRKAAR